jgi:hypothetical protein
MLHLDDNRDQLLLHGSKLLLLLLTSTLSLGELRNILWFLDPMKMAQ